MFTQNQTSFTPATIDRTIDGFFTQYPALKEAIGKEVYDLINHLRADLERGYLSRYWYKMIMFDLFHLCEATRNLDVNRVDLYRNLSKYDCNRYSTGYTSKWAALGAAIAGANSSLAISD